MYKYKFHKNKLDHPTLNVLGVTDGLVGKAGVSVT